MAIEAISRQNPRVATDSDQQPDKRAADLQATLERAIARLVGAPVDARNIKRLGEGLLRLHAAFIAESGPEVGGRYLSDPLTLAAYLAYFFPASAAQVRRAWSEIEPPRGERIRVLDLGSGPGPAAFATAEWLFAHGKSADVTLCESSEAALEAARQIWPARWGTVATRRWRAGEPLPSGPFDLVVASHFINELDAARSDRIACRAELLAGVAERISPEGRLLLIEPALRRTGRELLELRSELLDRGWSVVAPCLSSGPCPALERTRDWCHADRPWTAPELVERVAAAAGLKRESLKYSYLLLSRTPRADAEASIFRIVSEPMPERGKLRLFGCGSSGRHALVRLEKDRAAENVAFDHLERGDVVRLGETRTTGDGLRIGRETTVNRVVVAADLDGP